MSRFEGHTPEEARDLIKYHEKCRAMLPPGWTLYGSTAGQGCSALPPGSWPLVEFPEPLLSSIADLLRQRDELAGLVRWALSCLGDPEGVTEKVWTEARLWKEDARAALAKLEADS